MKIAVALATMVAIGLAMPSTDTNSVEWENYKQVHGKSYESAEMDSIRKNIYFQNKDKVEAHNERYEQGLVTFSMKLNHFADYLPEEMAALRGFRYKAAGEGGLTYNATNIELPASIDWRTKGAVTPVKNQGGCGSCWAFSTTGSLEGQWALKKGKLVSLSEQQIVDCTTADDGCGGGLMVDAFTYLKKNGGIETEASYPYKEMDESCSFNAKKVAARVTGYVNITQYSEDDLQHAVATVGPISVAIYASGADFGMYHEGVYDSTECNSPGATLDHAVLAVGYGVENGIPYWLVKNSWGPEWGAAGYVKMIRNKNNHCGIATAASYPLV